MKRWTSALALILLSISAASAHAGTNVVRMRTAPPQQKHIAFSADVITETTRTLQDGNRIDQVAHGKYYADADGRTRTEQSSFISGQEQITHITIFDPVEHVIIFLRDNQGQKVAHVQHLNQPASTHSTQSGGVLGAIVSSTSDGPVSSTKKFSKPVREDLGTREIEGFTAHGTRTTRTVEAGQVGNEQPMVITSESWTSPELNHALLTENDDPQSGHRTVKLQNIDRTEPDPSLFQIPPDYTVKDETTSSTSAPPQ